MLHQYIFPLYNPLTLVTLRYQPDVYEVEWCSRIAWVDCLIFYSCRLQDLKSESTRNVKNIPYLSHQGQGSFHWQGINARTLSFFYSYESLIPKFLDLLRDRWPLFFILQKLQVLCYSITNSIFCLPRVPTQPNLCFADGVISFRGIPCVPLFLNRVSWLLEGSPCDATKNT